ncbi:hypothetical protein [Sporosarcina gallistercoris]|uniref:WD40 repeat domain-containing protein n=1 Tax=Sporosarcina gallistercoris TaxID=2762245 RepID=A0ABR8PHN5_9BACL|nr:hypothetical protein [Sporosarcina gallistercoris]MBD7907687.1 hypothetical protein [Sporosarcina gallistercoris]
MTNRVQNHLDATLEERLVLEYTVKQRILYQAQQRLVSEGPPKRTVVKPLLTAAVFVVVASVLLVPYVQQEQQERTFQEFISKETIQKVIVPNVTYPSLINSIYVEENAEIIHTDEGGIYSYSIDDQAETVLVASTERIEFSSVDLAANENWVIWGGRGIHILNRQTGEQHVLLEGYGSFQLVGDQMIYLGLSEMPAYYVYDLNKEEKLLLHEIEGGGSSPAVTKEWLAVAEEVEEDNGNSLNVSIYNLENQELIQTYTLPYESFSYLTLGDDRIYGKFSSNGSDASLGYLDLATGKVHILDVPENSAYAIYDDYLALSVTKGESDTVKLFRLKESTAEPITMLDGVGERLVKPRFNESGKLIVNGEGPETPLYVIDTKKPQGN